MLRTKVDIDIFFVPLSQGRQYAKKASINLERFRLDMTHTFCREQSGQMYYYHHMCMVYIFSRVVPEAVLQTNTYVGLEVVVEQIAQIGHLRNYAKTSNSTESN